VTTAHATCRTKEANEADEQARLDDFGKWLEGGGDT
jgi:hypothetical protein